MNGGPRILQAQRALSEGIAAHQRGDLQAARAHYDRVLKVDPDQPDALAMLGAIAGQCREFARAEALLRRVLAKTPDHVLASINLARVFIETGRPALAVPPLEKALRAQPGNSEAHNALAGALKAQGQTERAIAIYRKLLAKSPAFAPAWNDLGNALSQSGRFEDAIAAYRKAADLAPRTALPVLNIARTLILLQRYEEAGATAEKLIGANAADGEALRMVARAKAEIGQASEAEALFLRAIALDSGVAGSHADYGEFLRQRGRFQVAIEQFDAALALLPADGDAQYGDGQYGDALFGRAQVVLMLGDCQRAIEGFAAAAAARAHKFTALFFQHLALPMVYERQADIAAHRTRWLSGLKKLHDLLDLSSTPAVEDALRAITSVTNFYLPYQGEDDLEAQRDFARLARRIAVAALPEYADAPARRPRRGDQRIRVGFASAFLHYPHSIHKMFANFIAGLDAAKFAVEIFYYGDTMEPRLEALGKRAAALHWRAGDARAWARKIRSAQLDVLVHCDVGMHPLSVFLASLRLARIQCNASGHPVSFGAPTLDYFLSGDALEPPDGAGHYAEKLVRLPRLGVSFLAVELAAPRQDRGGPLGEAPGPLFANLQSLFKLLPRYDSVYPRIAQAIGQCRFAFIATDSTYANEVFRRRMRDAFEAHGLDADRHCLMLPRLSHGDFLGLLPRFDVALDGLPWSGFNTTLEFAALDLPTVAMEGRFMRHRTSAAVMRVAGIDEVVASSLDHYVDIAVRLAQDRPFAAAVRAKLAANKARLYDDREVVDAFEAFLEQAVATANATGPSADRS